MKRICVVVLGVILLLSSCMKMIREQEEEKAGNTKTGKISLSLERESLDSALRIAEINGLDDFLSSIGDGAGIGNKQALDTSNYLLQISDSKGVIYYDGLYVNRPKEIDIPVGTYTISLRSRNFSEPSPNIPLFGEDRKVKAIADSTLCVQLLSAQMTGGIRVTVTDNFRRYFRGERLYYVTDTTTYRQSYLGAAPYVFYYPGKIKIVYKNKDGYSTFTPPNNPTWQDTLLLTRDLKANELVTINLDYDITRANTANFGIKVDTSRRRQENYFNLGFFAPYGSVSTVYAKSHIGDTVRLWGYIVGGNASTSTFVRKLPFTSKTHIVLAKEEWQTLRENVMAVELPNGNIRSQLNLVDHPELFKRKIVIDGVIVDSYFGHPGLKSVTAYQLY